MHKMDFANSLITDTAKDQLATLLNLGSDDCTIDERRDLAQSKWGELRTVRSKAPNCYYDVAKDLVDGPCSCEFEPPNFYKKVKHESLSVVIEFAPLLDGNGKEILAEVPSETCIPAYKIQCKAINVLPSTNWHAPRHYFHWLTKDTRELYEQKDVNRRGIILGVLGVFLVILRRLSFYEHFKHLFPSITGLNTTPAWVLDAYLLTWWFCSLFAFSFLSNSTLEKIPFWWTWFFLFLIVQISQTCFYHEIWRTLRQTKIAIQRVVHSRLRNFVIGIANFVFVTFLFGVVYFLANEPDVASRPFSSVLDSVFFSFTVAWSLGSLDIAPKNIDDFMKLVVMFQILVTLFHVSALLGILVGGIKPLPESLATETN